MQIFEERVVQAEGTVSAKAWRWHHSGTEGIAVHLEHHKGWDAEAMGQEDVVSLQWASN